MSFTYTNTFHSFEKEEKDKLADIQKPLCGTHRHSLLKNHYMFCVIWDICSLACTYNMNKKYHSNRLCTGIAPSTSVAGLTIYKLIRQVKL